ncbi:MAG: hypothetical protein M9894_08180 [Planctomycetes bacterium]|nr:hypothetical protein [Planctomycetota bacterium]
MRTHLGLVASLLLVAAPPAGASLVDRDAVTLGRLVDDLDLALVVRVDDARGDALGLTVLERLRGPATPDALRLDLSHEVACDLRARAGERLLLLLALGRDGVEAPVSVWQAVRLPDDGALALIKEAVASRAPTIGGDPRALERALFRQLEAPGAACPAAERVRADAALDLLAFQALSPGAGEVGALGRALDGGPTPDLARLAARVDDPALVAPLLRAARAPAAPVAARRAAAEALAALDPGAAAEALAADVDAPDAARAAVAVEGWGSSAPSAAWASPSTTRGPRSSAPPCGRSASGRARGAGAARGARARGARRGRARRPGGAGLGRRRRGAAPAGGRAPGPGAPRARGRPAPRPVVLAPAVLDELGAAHTSPSR